jgi:hypothetical protein
VLRARELVSDDLFSHPPHTHLKLHAHGGHLTDVIVTMHYGQGHAVKNELHNILLSIKTINHEGDSPLIPPPPSPSFGLSYNWGFEVLCSGWLPSMGVCSSSINLQFACYFCGFCPNLCSFCQEPGALITERFPSPLDGFTRTSCAMDLLLGLSSVVSSPALPFLMIPTPEEKRSEKPTAVAESGVLCCSGPPHFPAAGSVSWRSAPIHRKGAASLEVMSSAWGAGQRGHPRTSARNFLWSMKVAVSPTSYLDSLTWPILPSSLLTGQYLTEYLRVYFSGRAHA